MTQHRCSSLLPENTKQECRFAFRLRRLWFGIRRKGKTVEAEVSFQDCSWTENCMQFKIEVLIFYWLIKLSSFFFPQRLHCSAGNFLRQPQAEKESQSFSLIYQNGERSLDLVLFLLKTCPLVLISENYIGSSLIFYLILVWIVDFIVPCISCA